MLYLSERCFKLTLESSTIFNQRPECTECSQLDPGSIIFKDLECTNAFDKQIFILNNFPISAELSYHYQRLGPTAF